jgi:hypothetical protein
LGKTTVSKVVASETESLVGDPFIAVVAGWNTLLPLATFAKRDHGLCSYVQLGQEMEEDNFYVTTADDNSSRHDLIENLRNLLIYYCGRHGVNRTNIQHDGLQQFIDQQAERQAEPIARAYERQLVQTCFAKSVIHNGVRELSVAQADGTYLPGKYFPYTVIPPCVLKNGSSVELVLAQSPSNQDETSGQLDLLAVTRQNLAIPIARLSDTFNSIELFGMDDMDEAKRTAIIRQLLFAVAYRSSSISSYPEYTSDSRDEDHNYSHQEKAILEYCGDIGLMREREFNGWKGKDRNGNYSRYSIPKDIRMQLDLFFAYPDEGQLPFPDSDALELAVKRLGQLQAQDRALMGMLQIDEKVAEHVGGVRRCDEILMRYVNRIYQIGTPLSVVLNKIQIGKTLGNANVCTAIKHKDNRYQIRISGRPTSMPDEPLRDLISLELDPTKPYLGQADNLDKLFSEHNVAELIDIFSTQLATCYDEQTKASLVGRPVGSIALIN